MWKKFYGLVLESREGAERLSIGRICLVIVFGMSVYRWGWYWKDIPPGMLTFMMACLGYIVGGKAVEAAKNTFGQK